MKQILIALALCSLLSVNAQNMDNFIIVKNDNGATLGYSPTSGVKIITVNGKKFKDLNRNGKLDKYEDWRLPAEDRAKDLASKMTIEQIAGLMLYSGHQSIPAASVGYTLEHTKERVWPRVEPILGICRINRKSF